jgi:PAS domain S-box-containing protein
VALMMVLVIVGLARIWGSLEALTAALIGGIGFDHYLLPPRGFSISTVEDFLDLTAFVVTAIVTGQLVARLKRRRLEAEERKSEIEKLSKLGAGPEFSLAQLASQLTEIFGLDGVALYDKFAGQIIRSGPGAAAISDQALRNAVAASGISLEEAHPVFSLTAIRQGGEAVGSIGIRGGMLSDSLLGEIAGKVGWGMARIQTREIEDLQKGQEMLRTFVRQMPAAVAMMDTEMRYVQASERWCADYGLEVSQIVGRSHDDVFPDLPDHWKELHRRGLAGETLSADEDLFECADGRRTWLEWEIRPWGKRDGLPEGILIFSGDISQRKEAEELKSAILDAMAHEIRNPLGSAKLAVTTLLSPHAGSESNKQEMLTIIDQELGRIDRFIDETAQMARLEAKDLSLKKEPQNLARLIPAAMEEMRPLTDRRSVELSIPESLPPAECDKEMILHVLKQLVSNAVKYSPDDSPLAVSAEFTGEAIVIDVVDHGPGVDDAERDRIFEKYYRGRAIRSRIPGTGLGLASARSIVQAHGGQIWMTNQPAGGAAFHVSLPVGAA